MGKPCKACNKFYDRNRPTAYWYKSRPKHAKLLYIDYTHLRIKASKERTEVWQCPLCDFRYEVNRELYEIMKMTPRRRKRRPRRKRKPRSVPT